MNISAVIITKNEARNIGRCLASLESVADEIVVVDTFSEDGTQEIAKSHGARVIEKEWLGYSATKNLANETAQHEYVLSLDADEALTDTLKQSILAIKQTGGAGKVYTFNRLAFYGHHVQDLDEARRFLLCDPQTSGGLLVAVDPAAKDDFEATWRTLDLGNGTALISTTDFFMPIVV